MLNDFLNGEIVRFDELFEIVGKINVYEVDLNLIANSDINIHDLCPHLKEVICWDSGYLDSYVKEIKEIVGHNILFLSMSCTSTECTKTLCFGDYRLPMGRLIYYEFYDLDKTKILLPHQLQIGSEYIMIISNQHGLIRYDTNAVFLCDKKFLKFHR